MRDDEKEMRKEGFVTPNITILVAVGIALLGVGVWCYSGQIIAPPSAQIPPAAQDSTADWKTYRNEKYGFEVKYPPDFAIGNIYQEPIPPGSEEPRILEDLSFVKALSPQEGGGLEGISVFVMVFDNRSFSIDEVIGRFFDYRRDKVARDTTLGSKSARRFESKAALRAGVYTVVGDKMYAIEWPNFDSDDTVGLDRFNQILSTFRFISSTGSGQASPAVDTSSWKTYRNEKYGFEIKYPGNEWLDAYGFRVDDPYRKELYVCDHELECRDQFMLETGSSDDGPHYALSTLIVRRNKIADWLKEMRSPDLEITTGPSREIDGINWSVVKVIDKLDKWESEVMATTRGDFSFYFINDKLDVLSTFKFIN